MEILILMVILWYGGLFFQTFFLHRYAAHQTFTMSKFGERLCFFLTWVFQGSNYLSARAYGIMHRMHHAYADTELDPHSPKYDDNMFSMMWRTKTIFLDIQQRKSEIDPQFLINIPEWNWFDNIASSKLSRIVWGLAYTTFFFYFATAWWHWLFLPVAFAMAPIHGVIINWFAHIYGYTNFKVKDTSKNLLPFDFLMMGEGYHNNHHRFGKRPNFGGVRWHEIDPTYVIMLGLDKLNLIKLNKVTVPVEREVY
jgi:stearoyl-CoA desaturase (delta-9 desaturase)